MRARGFALHDVQIHQLTPDVVALHYTATQDGICNGEKSPFKVASTAIWKRRTASGSTLSITQRLSSNVHQQLRPG